MRIITKKRLLVMKKFQSSKYPISAILNEDIYLCFCNWVEELDDLAFDDETEEDKKFAHQEVPRL
jgi:hypothetical protein